MRIVHVVPLVSSVGAFGGPFTVALNLCRELSSRGHKVDLVAGWVEFGDAPVEVDGYPILAFRAFNLLPGLGFGLTHSSALIKWLREEMPEIDVLHVHAGRDLIGCQALDVAKGARTPAVLQTHGMLRKDHRVRVLAADLVYAKRGRLIPSVYFGLTDDEVGHLKEVLPATRHRKIEKIRNGVAASARDDHRVRQRTGPLDIIFCARLHSRKRPVDFVRMASKLRGANFRLSIVGPDEGELEAVVTEIRASKMEGLISYEGSLPYDKVLSRLRRADVYVLPSVDEPFPMSLLEAMSVGLPCVLTDSTGVSAAIAERSAGMVVAGRDVGALAAAVQMVIEDESLRSRLSEAALRMVREDFSMDAVVDSVEAIYCRVASAADER